MNTPKRDDSFPSQAGRYLGIGLTWVFSTALFLYLGSLGDKHFGTEPWLTVIGAFVGAAAGFYYLYTQAIRSTPKSQKFSGKSQKPGPRDRP